MTELDRREAARKFINQWRGENGEKSNTQKFWVSLLQNVYEMTDLSNILFERPVTIKGKKKYIDAYLPETRVLIEQKGSDKDLEKAEPQSDGEMLTPYEQAKRYANNMPLDEMPRYIVVCNFKEFWIYDQNKPGQDPEVIQLESLQDAAYRMEFLVKKQHASISEEMMLSMQAGEIVGKLYDAFYKQYNDPKNEHSQKSLNELCVRLVFCLYAEDSGLFGNHSMFHDYLASYPTKRMRKALIDLFRVLDQPENEREPYLDDDLAAFPYVNGGLFSDENIEIPPFTEEIRDLLLQHASKDFDWSSISPTIFGAVFESTLNPETRRSGGMHYTSIENIHKVIDPLFLDDLRAELAEIESIPVIRTRKNLLEKFQDKLASLTFLDPACGSGNFLTETYLSLRRLENEVIRQRIAAERNEFAGQIMLVFDKIYSVKVSISQFYGIEINDFAVTVAKTALWISEEQMIRETQEIIHSNIDFLPLKSYANIVEGNALKIDWSDVVPPENLRYIMGNPPFVGARLMTKSQKCDLDNVLKGWKKTGNLDYVSCWYKKASDFMSGYNIRAALVSTNSVTQGEPVAILWEPLFTSGIHIDFAHRTFVWQSEASEKAAVHCVIIGFSYSCRKPKIIYENNVPSEVRNINAYLADAPNIFVSSKKTPICNVPPMMFGSMPNDGGALSDYLPVDRSYIITKYPSAEPAFKKFVGATEFINNKERWCLWLKDVPTSLLKIPPIYDAISKVRTMRAESKRAATQKLASVPYLFGEIRQPEHGNYLLIPRHSSGNRRYIPIGYMSSDIICGDANLLIPNASLYMFGVMCSNVHNSWLRIVGGRIKSDYRYSINVVYNNFPWPSPSPEQRELIEQTAQGILDARALYPDSSLADLYDPLTMPPDLRKAHNQNNVAVMKAYGFPTSMSEADCVAALMKMYQELTEKSN